MVGQTTYVLLSNLDKPGDKTYDELVKVLKQHYNPTLSETIQSTRFNSRVRKPDETVAIFVSELHLLAIPVHAISYVTTQNHLWFKQHEDPAHFSIADIAVDDAKNQSVLQIKIKLSKTNPF